MVDDKRARTLYLAIAREGMYNPFLEPFNEPLEDVE